MELISLLIASLLINVINGCIHDGNTYKNGDTWVEKDAFVMRCNMDNDGLSWRVEITGCKTPSGITIPINSSKTDGNYEWKCTKSNDGQIVMQKQLRSDADCGEHKHGEQWRDKAFLYECGKGGQPKLIACFGENNVRVNIGESKEINGYIVKCEKYDNGTIVMHGIRKGSGNEMTTPSECIDSKGQHHRVGTSWIDDHRFNKTCLSNGRIDVVNCISRDGLTIPLNQEVIDDNVKYTCERTKEGAIRFAAGPAN